jgi:hypothetical protein
MAESTILPQGRPQRVKKSERELTCRFAAQFKGTLLPEYRVGGQTSHDGARWIDGIIVLGFEPHRHWNIFGGIDTIKPGRISLDNRDIIMVETKTGRLGRYLLGQVLFGRDLILDEFTPKTLRAVALCGEDDPILRRLAARYDIEVVIAPGS